MFGERPTVYRRTLGVLAIVVAIAAATAVWVQIADLLGQGAFVWFEYFSYFTIITTVLNIIALLFGGFAALSSERDTIFRTVVRQSLVTYGLISAGVYHLLLRDDLSTSDAYVSADSWPMQIFHTYVPAYLVIDWLINPYRRRSPWSSMILVFVLPALWFGFTLYRGQATGWFPYQFVNPGADAGWSGVIQHVALLAIAMGLIQLVLLGSNRILYGNRARQPVKAAR
jgi:hypothetical protein